MSVKVALVYHRPRMLATEDKIHGPDRDQPLPTLGRIQMALAEEGHETVAIDGTNNLIADVEEQSPDIAFNLYAVAGSAEQCFVPAVMDQMGVPYTGSDTVGHAVAMHKRISCELFVQEGVPTPPFAVCQADEEPTPDAIEFPALVKPCTGGSSEGIEANSLVEEPDDLAGALESVFENGQDALISQYVEGRELTVGLLGNDGDLRTLPILEKHLRVAEDEPNIFTGKMKKKVRHWHDDVTVPDLLPAVEEAIKDVAFRAFRAVGLRDYGRVDVRLSPEGTPYVLEVNSMPGLFPNFSPMTKMAKELDWRQTERLAREILRIAMDRCGLN
ncbi:MAG: ATP-grasp domain-containing protein [Armatimonadota bacterium]